MVIWLLIPVVVVSALLLILWQRYRHEPAYGLARYSRFFRAVMWCLALYSLNLLPYVAVKRSCFIYHYSEWQRSPQLLPAALHRGHRLSVALALLQSARPPVSRSCYALRPPVSRSGFDRSRSLRPSVSVSVSVTLPVSTRSLCLFLLSSVFLSFPLQCRP